MFQAAPKTPEEAARWGPLDIPPDKVAEMTEDEWYAKVYRGDDAPQLTLRAVGMGSVLGFFLAFTNLYIGLKTGWHLGVAITACIASFTLWTAIQRLGLAATPMTILENNCMQSTASAAGYSTGGTIVSAISALFLISGGQHLPWYVLATWTLLTAVLGVSLAIPMKRNMINHERLKFPSGLAAATTLTSLYASGDEALRKGRALLGSALIGALIPPLVDLEILKVGAFAPAKEWLDRNTLVPPQAEIFNLLPAPGQHVVDGQTVPYTSSDWLLSWDMNPVMVAAGAIVGVRISTWMMVSALVLIYVAGPFGLDAAWVNAVGKEVHAVSAPGKAWREIGLWLGAPMLVSSGILSFLFQWRTIVRAVASLRNSGGGDNKSAVEVPMSWFAFGAGSAGIGITLLASQVFDIPMMYGALAVFMTFFLALVACRATGESDITPTGAMGKIMQLTYGVLIPQSATANLMTAGITSGAASSSADLLNDLKSGYLLGANPRRQFLAQASGVLSGTLATTIGWYVMVPNIEVLTGTDDQPAKFAAPAAQAWKAMAEVFKYGIENMHPTHQNAMVLGLILGAILVTVETFAPKQTKQWLPSATGLGLGFILPGFNTLSMFVGAWLAWMWTKWDKKSADDYVVAVSSGLIAGVSIFGVIVTLINNYVLG